MRVRDWIGIGDRQQRIAAQAMQYALFGMITVGFYEGSVGVMVNAGVGFVVTYIPAILERDYDIQLDPALVLWITLAVFLHGFGTVGLPGAEAHPYRSIWWWDHMTHMFSASLVAGAGYVTVRALDEHTDAVRFPPRFTFVFILLFTMAFGVFWEVIEFVIALTAEATGAPRVLTQYGLEDTMKDLLFDTLGGIVVGLWGTAYLTGVTESVVDRISARRETD
ncbi:MAG: DUF2238 domain-containing protein [archaeon]